jgi:hypothetical protein
MALSQFPHSILPAAIGWVVGSAYRSEVLPWTSWRVPGWFVGQTASDKKKLDALRRRLVEETEATGTGAETTTDEGDVRRR